MQMASFDGHGMPGFDENTSRVTVQTGLRLIIEENSSPNHPLSKTGVLGTMLDGLFLVYNSVAIEVSSRPKLTGIVRGKVFLHVLRRRPIGCPDSRKRTR
ncbi:hypothetical protein TNCV_2527301 [Trichonephila clavipes]|nr:hypothetical protein TNCV_2527301 [Trichonephila clavipes]